MSMNGDPGVPSGTVDDWSGGYRSYDLIKEITIAVVVVAALALMLAVLFGSPRRVAVTFQEGSTSDPTGFLATTLDEVGRVSDTAIYGPPYNDTPGAGQSLFGMSPQRIVGERIPIDTAEDMVLKPLGRLSGAGEVLGAALAAYRGADPDQQASWVGAYRTGLGTARVEAGGVTLPPGDYGPLAVVMSQMLAMAQSGAVDGALIDQDPDRPGFFVFDYTRSQLYLADGDFFAGIGEQAGLAGDQWGMANTLGNWPGQPWLLPVSFWYQIPPGSTSGNGDIIVLGIVGILSLALVLLPFIPGLRELPLRLRAYRLIWRHHYRDTTAS